MSYSLFDLAKIHNGSAEVGIIDEVLREAPEMQVIPSRVIQGYNYKTLVRTGRPTTAFRDVNGGVVSSGSTFELRETGLFVLGSAITVDKAIAMQTGGALGDIEMDHAEAAYQDALERIATQFFRGTSADAKGFTGLQAMTPHTATTGTSTQVVNAGGTALTAASSVYGVKLGLKHVHLVFGGNTTLAMSPFRDEFFAPASGSGQVDGRVAALTGWVGLQIGSIKDICRIYNLTEDSGKGLTDALLAQVWAKTPPRHKPDVFFASTRSLRQLQISRTVVLNSGPSGKLDGTYSNVAPWPTEYMGIPIVESQFIPDTDAINA
jgi:hypothetical protein